MPSVPKNSAQHKAPVPLPWPFNSLQDVTLPPDVTQIANIVRPLLEQSVSLATSLHGGLLSAKPWCEEPARFAPTAFLLQQMLEAAVQVLTAWDTRPLDDKLAELQAAQHAREASGTADLLRTLERGEVRHG